jgi:hypothetical protein
LTFRYALAKVRYLAAAEVNENLNNHWGAKLPIVSCNRESGILDLRQSPETGDMIAEPEHI